jgi:hypothetical protein
VTLPAGTPKPSEPPAPLGTILPLPVPLVSPVPPGVARETPLCGIRQLALPVAVVTFRIVTPCSVNKMLAVVASATEIFSIAAFVNKEFAVDIPMNFLPLRSPPDYISVSMFQNG